MRDHVLAGLWFALGAFVVLGVISIGSIMWSEFKRWLEADHDDA